MTCDTFVLPALCRPTAICLSESNAGAHEINATNEQMPLEFAYHSVVKAVRFNHTVNHPLSLYASLPIRNRPESYEVMIVFLSVLYDCGTIQKLGGFSHAFIQQV